MAIVRVVVENRTGFYWSAERQLTKLLIALELFIAWFVETSTHTVSVSVLVSLSFTLSVSMSVSI